LKTDKPVVRICHFQARWKAVTFTDGQSPHPAEVDKKQEGVWNPEDF